jgi:hypothetical protein
LRLRRRKNQVQRIAFLPRAKLHHALLAYVGDQPFEDFAA